MPAPYETLKVWQLSHKLALQVYRLTSEFPRTERYGLISQLRRAATAIPTNIVEGNARIHRREYIQFCQIARASTAEVKYLLRLSHDLGFLTSQPFEEVRGAYEALGAMLHRLVLRLDDNRQA